jgi:O-antigen ligase
LVDTGIVGFAGYFLAQVFFFLAFWRLRLRGSPQARLASRFAVYIFLSYWITGMMLTSGYYSDLNLWYLFASAVIYKFGYTEQESLTAPARTWGPASAINLEGY